LNGSIASSKKLWYNQRSLRYYGDFNSRRQREMATLISQRSRNTKKSRNSRFFYGKEMSVQSRRRQLRGETS
jgi:hypothetical protein